MREEIASPRGFPAAAPMRYAAPAVGAVGAAPYHERNTPGGGEMVIRFTNALATSVVVTGLALGWGTLLTGCKSDDGQSAPAEKPAAAPAKAAPPKGAAAPASSPLSKVAANMSPEQVQEVMGAPTGQTNYPSAKTFHPYNFGNDSGNRVEYKYKG